LWHFYLRLYLRSPGVMREADRPFRLKWKPNRASGVWLRHWPVHFKREMGEHQQSRLLAKIAKKYVYSSSKHTGFLVALLVEIIKKILQDKSRLKKRACASAALYFKLQQGQRSSKAKRKINNGETHLFDKRKRKEKKKQSSTGGLTSYWEMGQENPVELTIRLDQVNRPMPMYQYESFNVFSLQLDQSY